MQNIVVINKRSKQKVIEQFIKSRGIINYMVVDTADEVFDSLLLGVCNLHIFDFIMDMSIINAIHELRDRANIIKVYVTSIESAQPYLSLTDDIQIMPEEFDIMSFFWDNPACNVRNVMAFAAMGKNSLSIYLPKEIGETQQMSVDIETKKIPVKYENSEGKSIKTDGAQIVLTCKTKSQDKSEKYKVRVQSDVYTSKDRTLEDLPDLYVEDMQEEPEEAPVLPEVANTEITQDSKEHVDEKVAKEKHSFFSRKSKKKDVQPEPAKTEKQVEQKEYISFKGYMGTANGKSESSVPLRKAHKRTLSLTCSTIAEYCLTNNFISNKDHDALMEELRGQQSKETLFGDLALQRGLITEEQLIAAITSVMGIGVMTWKELENIKPNYSILLKERCLKYKVFQADNSTVPGADDRDDIIIASTSLAGGINELSRLFDCPIIKYTLDCYIIRKLEDDK